jgi:2-polyprenyl-3-methyl-5-hydroxy-6-metoxy-1,4-benzoquinol methylase
MTSLTIESWNCAVCERHEASVYVHLKSNNLIALKCKQCGHVFIKNSPITANNIEEFYTMEDFKGNRQLQEIKYPDYYSHCFADYDKYITTSLVLKQFQEKADYFNSRFLGRRRLLDVGCATGVFLDMMKKRGWEVEGTEVSEELASYARKAFDVEVHVRDLTKKKLISEQFHVITLFDVIEHILDPNSMIAACRDLLTNDGLLLLRTPTEEGLLRDIAKAFYFASLKKIELPMLWFYSFEHIQSFSLSTMRTILNKHKMSIFKVFRENEPVDRINIPRYLKIMMVGVNYLASLSNKSHKITVIAQKC